jgi:hypothetical protein
MHALYDLCVGVPAPMYNHRDAYLHACIEKSRKKVNASPYVFAHFFTKLARAKLGKKHQSKLYKQGIVRVKSFLKVHSQ